MSCLIYAFKMISCCGCRNKVVNQYAFYPPTSSYMFEQISQRKNSQYVLQTGYEDSKEDKNTTFNNNEDPNFTNCSEQNNSISSPSKLKSDRKKSITMIHCYQMKKSCNLPFYKFLLNIQGQIKELPPLQDLSIVGYKLKMENDSTKEVASIYIEYTKKQSDYIILFSHGNSTDLGYMLDSYLDLAYNCQINVFAYDYTGYGLSNGQLNDQNTLRNIETVYKFLTKSLKYEWSKIILYGQSVGSGPSTYLASNYHYPVGGLIIHSGFMSGLRIMNINLQKTEYLDIFPNIDEIQYVNCPVFIIHGSRDESVNVEHAIKLQQKVKKAHKPWYVEGAGHNNIENDKQYRKDYFLRMREFLKHIKGIQAVKTNEELLLYCRADMWDNKFNHLYRQMIPNMTAMNSIMNSQQSSALRQQNAANNEANQQSPKPKSIQKSLNISVNQTSSLEDDLLEKKEILTQQSKSLTEMRNFKEGNENLWEDNKQNDKQRINSMLESTFKIQE